MWLRKETLQLRKVVKKISLLFFSILVMIQLYQPARNKSTAINSSLGFVKKYAVPRNIENILLISCYDCHSNTTIYQWYDLIQPARILVEMHIKGAKQNLNFDEWGSYSKRKQETKLDRIIKQIKADEMPIVTYTFMHRNAKLSDFQKKELIDWISKMKEKFPSNM